MSEHAFKECLSEAALDAIIKYAVTESVERRIAEVKTDNTPYTFSKRHERRMKALFKHMGRRIDTYINRIVAAIAVLLIMTNGVLLTNAAVRGAVGGAVITWFDKYAKFSSEEAPIAVLWEPAYVPGGYFEIYRNQQDEGISMLLYTDEDDKLLQFLYDSDENSLSVNNEGVVYGQEMKDAIVYHTFTAETDEYASSVVWDMDGYRFCVAGMLPIDELLRIAQSVS